MNTGDARDSDEGVRSPAAAALEAVVDPIVAISEGTITYANGAARDAFDLPVESSDGEDRGETWDAAAHLQSWPRLETAIGETTVGTARRVSFPGDWDQYEARVHRSTEGATITFEPARGETEGAVSGGGASVLGARDRAVKERTINEAPVGITISDPALEDNPLVYINDAYQEITGYGYDEVVGRNCRFLQGEDSSEAAIAEMAAAIDEDRPVTVELKNYRKDGTEFWNEVTIAPVRDETGTVTHYVGFQNDVTARKEAELELEARTEELEYTLDRVEGLIGDVTDAVAGSTDRSALEAAVCDRIVDEATYDGAWIGERNPATGTIGVRAATGETPAEPVAMSGDHPAAAALAADDAATATVEGTTRAAFPLTYNGIEYGVLTVRLGDDRGIDDREAVVLSALARAVASGVNARETSRVLETDAVVAVDLALSDRSVAPVALTAAVDCRLAYRRSVHRTGDETASLFTATGADATSEALTAAAEDAGFDCRVVVERDDECLIELSGGDDLVGWLSERGVRTQTIESEGGRARITLEIPRSANVRSIVEAVEDRYDGFDVISFQQRERDGETRQEFAARLEDDLTERQFVALQRAYLSGYFEWPRPTTGEELARSMDVSRPTFHEHLRSAEAKLCRAFFGGPENSG
ncbi:bacterio-opsin activator domain-containing protein [Natronolimnohabitans innermongolicus]|uniref:Bacterio-opsin activator n=1 Tax=Natronolimnohabitans innermongolicus JCM 12255 TaxID=1227499 RepID=L9XE91_9EURY|nr:bacterio-opsin activator domain-containing protein [Natronolimnohabitans innermongolicus]ELY58953.1 bacterio-opsin activator [Natronolimnohabitans innermongolicus JCM 12255]